MRFRVVQKSGREAVAASDDGQAWSILFADEKGFPGFPDEFVEDGPVGIKDAGAAILRGAPVADIEAFDCLPPFRKAGKILCVGLNFAGHVREIQCEDAGIPNCIRPLQYGSCRAWTGHGSSKNVE